MRLQTDPTVIYGMGERFRRQHPQARSHGRYAWNTNTRDGLPPGAGSLSAVVIRRPVTSSISSARTHYFSKTLEEHNRAVAKYQLKP